MYIYKQSDNISDNDTCDSDAMGKQELIKFLIFRAIAEDQCKALTALGATPCDGGRVCSPRNNHYECRCPQDMKWNEQTKRCTGNRNTPL